jgi:predicted AAA+ superfamily ATPase
LALSILEGQWDIVEPFHEKLIQYLRIYYYVGGLPEAVNTYLASKNLDEVRHIQKTILLGYENDFAKYAPSQIVPKIRMVWQGILGQLAKENKKFMYGQLKKGARAKEFEAAINWLVNAGLLLKCEKINKPAIPLKTYADFDVFKLFVLDIGLLNAMAQIAPSVLLNKNQILVEFKGALTEQFVAQELKINFDLHYWSTEASTAELDFIIQHNQDIIPIETKAEENLKAKSLKLFEDKFVTKQATRISMGAYRKQDWLMNLPLYAIQNLA